MSILTVQKIITSSLKLTEEDTRTLYGLTLKCLQTGWDWADDTNENKFTFNIEPDEHSLLERIRKDIEKSEILELINT